MKKINLLLIIATLFIGIGYAAINSISLNLNGDISIQVQDGIFITEVTYLNNINANTEISKIIDTQKTTLNSNIYLSTTDQNSQISYKITIYNSTDIDYYFYKTKYSLGNDTYNNNDITFSLNGLKNADILKSKTSITFIITFHYKNQILSKNNNLKSYLNFKFTHVICPEDEEVCDLSGNGNHAKIIGANWDEENNIITTDGIESYLDLGLNQFDFKNKITLIIKVKFNNEDFTKEKFIFGNWESAGGGLSIYNEKLIFAIHTNDLYNVFTSTFTPENNIWYDIIGMYDGNKMSIYVNGEKQKYDNTAIIPSWAQKSCETLTGNIKISTTNMAIGANLNNDLNPNSWNLLSASYQKALLFNSTLTDEEINNYYNDETTIYNKEGLLAHYIF